MNPDDIFKHVTAANRGKFNKTESPKSPIERLAGHTSNPEVVQTQNQYNYQEPSNDIDFQSALQQRLSSRKSQEESKSVKLKEGFPVFVGLNSGPMMAGAVSLARKIGSVQKNYSQLFEAKAEKKFYIVKENEKVVDIGRVQSNEHLLTNLVEVASINGNFLVPREALMEVKASGGSNNGGGNSGPRKILNNSMLLND